MLARFMVYRKIILCPQSRMEIFDLKHDKMKQEMIGHYIRRITIRQREADVEGSWLIELYIRD